MEYPITTIACNLDMMAADQKVTLWHGVSYRTTKIISVKVGKTRILAGAAGNGSDCSRFLQWAMREFKPPIPEWNCQLNKGDDEDLIDYMIGLILRPDGIYIYTTEDSEPEKLNETSFAIGSGGKGARVALMLGKTPEEAVKLASMVDDPTGNEVEVLYLHDREKEKENK